MTDPIRRRGRPKGTTKPGDDALLQRMADVMLGQPELKPTAAIKQIVPNWTDTLLHRLCGKWKTGKEQLLSAAQVRQNPKHAPGEEVRCSSLGLAQALSDYMARVDVSGIVQQMERTPIDSDALRTIREFQNTEAASLARLVNDLPTVRLMREMKSLAAVQLPEALRRNRLY